MLRLALPGGGAFLASSLLQWQRRAHTAVARAASREGPLGHCLAGAQGEVRAPAFQTRAQSSSASGSVATEEAAAARPRLSTAPTVPPALPLVLVVSGPSGVGKDAVIRRLQEQRPDLHFVVTATSRPMRPGEVHGIDYFFVSRQQFEDWVAAGELLEHAVVYGEYKGIPRRQVEEALKRGTDVVLRLDVQGAATVSRLLPGCVRLFLVAESEAALVSRLVARKTESPERMALRVATAQQELKQLPEFDYVVVNREGELDETSQKIRAIITAEKCRVVRRLERAADELQQQQQREEPNISR